MKGFGRVFEGFGTRKGTNGGRALVAFEVANPSKTLQKASKKHQKSSREGWGKVWGRFLEGFGRVFGRFWEFGGFVFFLRVFGGFGGRVARRVF